MHRANKGPLSGGDGGVVAWHRVTIGLLIAAVTASLVTVASQASSDGTVAATPRQAWDAFQRAGTEGKFAEAFDYLTPAAQEENWNSAFKAASSSLKRFAM